MWNALGTLGKWITREAIEGMVMGFSRHPIRNLLVTIAVILGLMLLSKVLKLLLFVALVALLGLLLINLVQHYNPPPPASGGNGAAPGNEEPGAAARPATPAMERIERRIAALERLINEKIEK